MGRPVDLLFFITWAHLLQLQFSDSSDTVTLGKGKPSVSNPQQFDVMVLSCLKYILTWGVRWCPTCTATSSTTWQSVLLEELDLFLVPPSLQISSSLSQGQDTLLIRPQVEEMIWFWFAQSRFVMQEKTWQTRQHCCWQQLSLCRCQVAITNEFDLLKNI